MKAQNYQFNPDDLDDLADADPGQPSIEKLRANARRLLGSPQQPGVEYPTEALGSLCDVAVAIAAGTQVVPALAGQCVLGTAALLTQHKANVRTIESVKPLSLFLLSIGDSGDGKSTAEAVALAPVTDWQREQTKAFKKLLEQIEQTPKGETPPPMQRAPYRVNKDATVEGIRRGFADGHPSQGVFTSEAATLLCGYGMSADNRLKSAGSFNGLWDCGEISVSRSLAGRIQLYDRRLSLHWMIQPDAAREAVNDPALTNIGFWPRFLTAWPEPPAPRLARRWRADSDATIGEFWRRCTGLLNEPADEDCSDLPTLEPSVEAMQLAGQFFERMEYQAKHARGTLGDIKPFAIRATEQAFRIAGVLAAFDARTGIDADDMRRGITLASYSLETWRGIFGEREHERMRVNAIRLFSWLTDQPAMAASERSISRIGPKPTRSSYARDGALSLLAQVGLCRESRGVWSVTHE